MSGKILARVPALSLALLLAACGGGGGGDSTPLVDTGESGGNGSSGGDSPQEVFLGLGINSGDTFIEGQIESDIKALSAGGTTRLRVFIVDRNNSNRLLTGEETEVRFSSNCVSTNDAELISPIVTSTGVAETTYTAKGCSPTDTILAKVNGAEASFTLKHCNGRSRQSCVYTAYRNINSSNRCRINGTTFRSLCLISNC
ncbi:MAG: hypothetical protein MH208_03625 [Marinobacter sp.]|nr:hypothetical protein [Marinobacter sp.]